MFVRTADENYITARWCEINRLHTDFLWLAVHALEKYLKAVLLLNGGTSKGYGHNIEQLFADVRTVAGPLLPDQLQRPARLNLPWFDRSADDFIKHLLSNGNADNRYLIYGYATRAEDLHMLDAMVFAIRRLVCNLDAPHVRRPVAGFLDFTNRELLSTQPEHYDRHGMPLDDLIYTSEESGRRYAALNLNMSFAPEDYPHQSMRGGSSARNPVIIRRILDPLGSRDKKEAAEGIALARWFLESVQVPKGKPGDPGVFEQIQEAIDAARTAHGLP